jgi:hypothetical protein
MDLTLMLLESSFYFYNYTYVSFPY